LQATFYFSEKLRFLEVFSDLFRHPNSEKVKEKTKAEVRFC
jgi:hypothetical protein